ncbi:unnamed protein product [Clonostachys rosea]|uniref:SET domain-containing protein n=1 Tax=Bionectria ochroleuca TaxID=29856 RepID=A0ABY6V490_BIOOC|nr:unnamed protein product [Clonostachys rosea]
MLPLPAIISRLSEYRKEMGKTHDELARHVVESTEVVDRRIHYGKDLFTALVPDTGAESGGMSLKIKIKNMDKGNQRKDVKETLRVTPIKTVKMPVPRYFSHPVQIGNNVVAPQTPMAFYPHKGDLDTPRKQKKWKGYIKDLDNSEASHGLDSIKLDEKRPTIIHFERVVSISTYLDSWLKELALPDVNKWTLLLQLHNKGPEKPLTTEQYEAIKTTRVRKDFDVEKFEAGTTFQAAWKRVFGDEKTKHGIRVREVSLLEVLLYDRELKAFVDSDDVSDESSPLGPETAFERLESTLQTYSSLGCLICFKHSCEHGFFTDGNERKRFALEKGWLARRLTEKSGRKMLENRNKMTNGAQLESPSCDRKCYITYKPVANGVSGTAWTDAERNVLRTIFMSASCSLVSSDPICQAAVLLDRDCYEVHREYQTLGISLPEAPANRAPRDPEEDDSEEDDEVPNLSWYNRFEHKLSRRPGAGRYHTPNWDHINRDIDDICALRGCDHDGPCSPSNEKCPCAKKGHFCEKFCGCTVENCAYKFTGCDCGLRGKPCHQKGEECICVQLNRECDPDLCHSCGAFERADPKNARKTELLATGCQNCSLQRGSTKDLVLGKSQFHGYGLYSSEPIRKDEFIIEYVGELVSGEEGDRRYIRRQNLFDGTKPLSFNFTLLKECNVWIDGARYGNLSRYVNHADGSSQKCNVTPKILLVNGCFRIAFRAKRNIKPWEELLFDYGEDFGLGSDKGKRRKKRDKDDDDEDDEDDEDEGSSDNSSSENASNSESDEDFPMEEPERRNLKRKRAESETSEEEYAPSSENNKSPRKKNRGGSAEAARQARRMRNTKGGLGNGAAPKANTRKPANPSKETQRPPAPARETSTSQSESPALAEEPKAKRPRLSQHKVISDSDDEEESEGDEMEGSESSGDEDDEESSQEEDDESDDDFEKREKSTRNRRRPAKFKDDEVYALGSGKSRRARDSNP